MNVFFIIIMCKRVKILKYFHLIMFFKISNKIGINNNNYITKTYLQ